MSLSVFDVARHAPASEALITPQRVYTFAELAEDTRRVVIALRESGIREGEPWTRVAVVARSTPRDIAVLLALLSMRVPIVLVHPKLMPPERLHLVARSQARLIVDGESVASTELDAQRPADACEEPMVIVPTSGTTGAPKLVALDESAFIASARASAANLGWVPQDRWLLDLPLAHVGGVSILTRCLAAGRAVVLPGEGRFDASRLLQGVEAHRVTLLSLVPTMLQRVLALGPISCGCASVRAVLLGGAPASPALLERAGAAGWPILATYGLTEACSQVATTPYGTPARAEQGVGRPLQGVEVRIVAGLVQVRGPMMMRGYLGEPSPFLPDGWFPTGDAGHLDDAGFLHVRGRGQDMIISGGENVSPLEVEAQLEACPGVDAVCVFGIDDATWGQVVAAAVVGAVTPEGLANFCAQHLAAYKRPRWIATLPALPQTHNGKVDRAATIAQVWQRLQSLSDKQEPWHSV